MKDYPMTHFIEELIKRCKCSGFEAFRKISFKTGRIGLGEIGVSVRSCPQSDPIQNSSFYKSDLVKFRSKWIDHLGPLLLGAGNSFRLVRSIAALPTKLQKKETTTWRRPTWSRAELLLNRIFDDGILTITCTTLGRSLTVLRVL